MNIVKQVHLTNNLDNWCHKVEETNGLPFVDMTTYKIDIIAKLLTTDNK